LIFNKKAIDYVARDIQEKTKTTRATPIENRIIYVAEDKTIIEKYLIKNHLIFNF